jgi:hypothetical protein
MDKLLSTYKAQPELMISEPNDAQRVSRNIRFVFSSGMNEVAYSAAVGSHGTDRLKTGLSLRRHFHMSLYPNLSLHLTYLTYPVAQMQVEQHFDHHCTCSWWLADGGGAGQWRKRRAPKLMREQALYVWGAIW